LSRSAAGLPVAFFGRPVAFVGSIVTLTVTDVAVVLAMVQPLLSVIKRRNMRGDTSVAQLRIDLSFDRRIAPCEKYP
jgi:hypothetical protein